MHFGKIPAFLCETFFDLLAYPISSQLENCSGSSIHNHVIQFFAFRFEDGKVHDLDFYMYCKQREINGELKYHKALVM